MMFAWQAWHGAAGQGVAWQGVAWQAWRGVARHGVVGRGGARHGRHGGGEGIHVGSSPATARATPLTKEDPRGQVGGQRQRKISWQS